MSILEELYDGNIAPMERDIRRGSEYHKILKRIDEQQKSLALSLGWRESNPSRLTFE